MSTCGGMDTAGRARSTFSACARLLLTSLLNELLGERGFGDVHGRFAVDAGYAGQPGVEYLWVGFEPGLGGITRFLVFVEYGVHQVVFHLQGEGEVGQQL